MADECGSPEFQHKDAPNQWHLFHLANRCRWYLYAQSVHHRAGNFRDPLCSNSVQIGKTSYGYNAHGRQSAITDARNGTTTLTFNSADRVATATTPPPGTGDPPQTMTTY